MLKGQDIVVLLALMGAKKKYSYAELANKASLSVSESHAAIKRLQIALLVNEKHRLVRKNVEEFLIHALKYAFPLQRSGTMNVGMPTAYSSPIAESEFAATGRAQVWCGSEGKVIGMGVEPIYSSAPSAAKCDQDMYDKLALIDMLRGGRVRERNYASSKLMEMMR